MQRKCKHVQFSPSTVRVCVRVCSACGRACVECKSQTCVRAEPTNVTIKLDLISKLQKCFCSATRKAQKMTPKDVKSHNKEITCGKWSHVRLRWTRTLGKTKMHALPQEEKPPSGLSKI